MSATILVHVRQAEPPVRKLAVDSSTRSLPVVDLLIAERPHVHPRCSILALSSTLRLGHLVQRWNATPARLAPFNDRVC
jgi:hypothetical protein